MKRKTFIYLASLFLLTGCDYNDKYFDGLDEITKPTDVKSIEYTLTDEDYATIASNATNKSLAEAAGVLTELNNLRTTKRFTETLPVSVYAPAFIASKWFTGSSGSSVKLTYNEGAVTPDYVTELNGIDIYKVIAADYELVWGAGSSTNFFTPTTTAQANIPKILARAYTDVESGTIVAVDYNQSDNEPSGAVVAINEDFNIFTGMVNPVELDGWNHVVTEGTNNWQGRLYSGNGFIQANANGHAGLMETYMISPKFKVTPGLNLTFEACYGYYKDEGGRASVLISSDLAGFTVGEIQTATWDDITSSFYAGIATPSSEYGTLAPAGSHNLDAYIGKDVYIAFRYNGNGSTGATTTVQIDNVVVKSEASGGGGDIYYASTGLYKYDGTSWAAYSGNGYMLTKADYTSMGLSYDNFSGTQPDHYIPTFLNQTFAYAQADDIKVITYKYFVSGSGTSVRADEYVRSETGWMKAAVAEETTSQFVKNDEGEWNFDPSVVITLQPARNNAESMKYYQAIVDYVGTTYDTGYYQIGYTNAEYYYGASAYQNNFDFRVSAWRASHSNGSVYDTFSDTELEALMYERLKEAFIPALKANHGDLKPVDGLNVFCTINFAIYKGTAVSSPTHTIQYKVTAPGQFEYVENSFKEL